MYLMVGSSNRFIAEAAGLLAVGRSGPKCVEEGHTMNSRQRAPTITLAACLPRLVMLARQGRGT